MSDKSLIAQAQSGDTQAFDQLVKECSPKLQALLSKHYHLQPTDFDDVIQIATNKAWTKLKNFRGDSSFLTWFYTILRNETLNFLHRRSVIDKYEMPSHPVLNTDNDESDYPFFTKDVIDQQLTDTAASLLERKETLGTYRQILDDVLNNLTPNHRQIIKMVVEDEMSYKEIASKLNISIGTVMSRMYYARQHAQQLIKEYTENNDIQLSNLG